MAQTATFIATTSSASAGRAATRSEAGFQAYWILRLGFIAAPILAGLDKFTHLMVDWTQYLSPLAVGVLGGHATKFMMAVGVVEIAAGLGVAWRPRVFAYVVSAWLGLIVVNLLMLPGFYDVALRDFGLALAALALARLSQQHAG